MSRLIDLSGQRFGRLLVVRLTAKRFNDKHPRWLCQCDCGTRTDVVSPSLVNGFTNSCGCLRKEVTAARSTTHGASRGRRCSHEYMVWASAKDRCHNPRNKQFFNYGGSGIVMCDEWRSDFARFSADMGPRPKGRTLDRIDNDGPYSHTNCRWATRIQQANNTRRNRRMMFRGQAFTLPELARFTGVPPERLRARLERGWTIERAASK